MLSQNSMPWDILKNSWFTYKNRNKTGINHITGHIHDVILGLIGCKVVLTIHDLVFLDNAKNPIKRFYKWLFWLYLPIKLSDKVVCISNHTKENVLKYVNAKNLSVIHNPIDPQFEFSSKEFNSEKPVILHIGTGWNKNLHRVIEALSNVSCHLRIIGILSQSQKTLLLKAKIDYSNISGLTDQEIQTEYKSCDIVSFPSEYEGFGMPIIEGQKTGRIVVTSKIEPLIEVSGDAVVYVNPASVASIRKAFLKTIADDLFRNEKISSGLANVNRFEVQKISERYLNLYKNILK